MQTSFCDSLVKEMNNALSELQKQTIKVQYSFLFHCNLEIDMIDVRDYDVGLASFIISDYPYLEDIVRDFSMELLAEKKARIPVSKYCIIP